MPNIITDIKHPAFSCPQGAKKPDRTLMERFLPTTDRQRPGT